MPFYGGGGIGSLRNSLRMAAVAAPGTPGAITFDTIVKRTGNSYAFTARRTMNIANAETHTATLAPSSLFALAARSSDLANIAAATINFVAGSATAIATFNSVPATVQPE